LEGGVTEEKRSDRLDAVIEAILFASGTPIHIARICEALDIDRPTAEMELRKLEEHYETADRGVRLQQMDDWYQMCSAPAHADAIRRALEMRKPPKLSRSSLEVLTIIAYQQPVTRARIEQIRGVECSYIISLLLDMRLIERCGQLDAVGRPLLYRTTTEFLRYFHLKSLRELPELPTRFGFEGGNAQTESETEKLKLPENFDNLAFEEKL